MAGERRDTVDELGRVSTSRPAHATDAERRALMWLITTRGFYSAVARPGDGDDFVTVRARSERDIRNLADLIDAVPSRDDGTDYRRRIRFPKSDWARGVSAMADEIHYDNFKNRISPNDPNRARVLSRVWNVLYDIQRKEGGRTRHQHTRAPGRNGRDRVSRPRNVRSPERTARTRGGIRPAS
jgi:hypothetical protein